MTSIYVNGCVHVNDFRIYIYMIPRRLSFLQESESHLRKRLSRTATTRSWPGPLAHPNAFCESLWCILPRRIAWPSSTRRQRKAWPARLATPPVRAGARLRRPVCARRSWAAHGLRGLLRRVRGPHDLRSTARTLRRTRGGTKIDT